MHVTDKATLEPYFSDNKKVDDESPSWSKEPFRLIHYISSRIITFTMKLDAKAMRYLTNEDFRVLSGVSYPALFACNLCKYVFVPDQDYIYLKIEIGSRNHEVVPTPLIIQLSGLRGGSGVHKSISSLAKLNLIARVKNARCTALQPLTEQLFLFHDIPC